MPQCDHGHGSTHADKWTNIAAVGEGVSSFISDAYWLGSLFDIVTGLPSAALGLSFYAIAFGTVSALLSATGAAYSHRILNTVHQPNSPAATEGSRAPILHSAPSVDAPLTESSPQQSHHRHLSWQQRLALTGDFVSHAGDIAGPLTFVVNLASHNTMPRWGSALVQCVATLFGGLSAVANVRSCKDAMLINEARHDHSGCALA